MKLHFESNLDYQLSAIEAVCDLFRGQETCRSEFAVTTRKTSSQVESDLFPDSTPNQMLLGVTESVLGIGNKLTLLDDEILENLHTIQLREGLPPSGSLASGDFTVEMETGTGKTYVYLRSIFELNKRYGFTKFVIVVPSIAIKEGVYKSLQITEDHFKTLYSGIPFDYFIYDSSKLGQVRNFAASSNIQIMVVTVGAINKFGDEDEAQAEELNESISRQKSKNVMYRHSEKTGGERPIDLIRATCPIVIVDEPQSVDGGLDGRGKKAMQQMHPLCTLRYSATHADKHHMVYRLDAVDAYERKLVKQIEVAAATVQGGNNKAFVRILSISNKHGIHSAKLELDVDTSTGVQRREVVVQDGDDLEQATKRTIYADFRIGEIKAGKDDAFVELRYPGGEKYLRIGEAEGDVDSLAIQREMIRRTIKEHLDKEKRLRPQGIKVLSLFFVDAVNKYRQYDANGTAVKGPYAQIFEEEYLRFSKHPDYQGSFKQEDLVTTVEEVHNGYFSIDNKKVGGKSIEFFKDTKGDSKADDDTYNLIMRDKEKLLSFETPLKFIFSHSALREGWDNPNVFQICTLREIRTEHERRQTIGRGLRLCVNQEGQRLRGFDVNTLTVIATESYEQFAENLQKEIEADTGIRFGIVLEHQFASLIVKSADGKEEPLGFDHSKRLWVHLKNQGYIDAHGKVQDKLKLAIKDGSLIVPAEFEAQRIQISYMLRKLSGKFEIKNADERTQVRTRQAILHSPEFKELWDRIKHKTTYRVKFDNEKLIKLCIEALKSDQLQITKTRLQWRKADISIGKGGIDTKEKVGADTVALNEGDIDLPDLITYLQDRTQLTRKSITRILVKSERLNDFKRNPQQFIELTGEIINRQKRLSLVDGISYQRLGDDHFYAQELFETQELTGYLKNLIDTQKSVYEKVVYDSVTEKDFATQLEMNDSIKLYAKLPGWFQVPTPLGTYNPDWAILIEHDGIEKLYFVVETKSSLFNDDLGAQEIAKINCGKVHFSTIATESNPARFVLARSVEDVLMKL